MQLEEIKTKQEINWSEILSEDCSNIPSQDINTIAEAAVNWVTCAVGHQNAMIPRDEDGQPLDETLNHLGRDFHNNAIFFMCMKLRSYYYSNGGTEDAYIKRVSLAGANYFREKALEIFNQIEARAKVLTNG